MMMFFHICMAQIQTLADLCHLFSFETGSPLSTILPGAGVVSEAAMEATSRNTKGGGDQRAPILARSGLHSLSSSIIHTLSELGCAPSYPLVILI